MAWIPPVSKWKTNLVSPADCGNASAGGVGESQCRIRRRFDALADPRIVTTAGFESVCVDHFDDLDPPVIGEIELFTGEWMRVDEWHAYEAAWYSWVVWHEIAQRSDVSIAERQRMQKRQVERGRAVANGVRNLADRITTEDGPWKPLSAITNPTAQQRAAVLRHAGWAFADGTMRSDVIADAAARGADPDAIMYWFEGTKGDRVLHIDTDGALTPAQRNQISAAVDLRYGAGRIEWAG